MDEEKKETTVEETPTETTSIETTTTDTAPKVESAPSQRDLINNMYDANIASKKANIQGNMDNALAEAQRNKDQIASTYNQQRNELSASYERNRRNNNLSADKAGLNTGAGSQMRLGQMNAYMQSNTALNKGQADKEADADLNMTTIKNQYQMAMQQAEADNDFNRMQALYEEGVRAEEQARDDAGVQASFGDFSGYVPIYGKEVADQMARTWAMQNPLLAYNLGKLTADEYRGLTGTYPPGYSAPSSGGGGAGWGGSSGKTIVNAGGVNASNGNEAIPLEMDAKAASFVQTDNGISAQPIPVTGSHQVHAAKPADNAYQMIGKAVGNAVKTIVNSGNKNATPNLVRDNW